MVKRPDFLPHLSTLFIVFCNVFKTRKKKRNLNSLELTTDFENVSGEYLFYRPTLNLREGNVFNCVCHSVVAGGGEGSHVTITNDTLDLTIPPYPLCFRFQLLDMGPHYTGIPWPWPSDRDVQACTL